MKKLMLILLVLLSSIGLSGAEYLEPECLYQRGGSYITSVYAGDLDGDGVLEIFAGADNGVVMDFPYSNCRRQWSPAWQYIQKGGDRGYIVDMELVDFEKDGRNELIVAANTREEYLFLISDEGVFKWADEKAGGLVLSMDVADIDEDGLYEIIVGDEGNNVVAIDGENQIKWKTSLDNPVYFVEVLDVDDDGSLDVVALTNEYLESANVYVLDGNGKKVWNYSIDEGIYHASENLDNIISAGDLDNDNKLEFVVGSYRQGVVVLDHNGNKIWDYPTEKLVNSVHVSDSEVVFSSNPYLYLLDSAGNLKSRININGSALIIEAEDFENDGFRELLLGTNNVIQVVGWDGVLKGSWDIGKDINVLSMYVSDLDNDGRKEIIAGYGWGETRLGQRYTSGELVALKVTWLSEVTTTTTKTTTSTVLEASTTTVAGVTTTFTTPTTLQEEEAVGVSAFLVVMILLVVLAVLVIAAAAFYFMSKKKEAAGKEEGIIEDIVEERETEAKGKETPKKKALRKKKRKKKQ